MNTLQPDDGHSAYVPKFATDAERQAWKASMLADLKGYNECLARREQPPQHPVHHSGISKRINKQLG